LTQSNGKYIFIINNSEAVELPAAMILEHFNIHLKWANVVREPLVQETNPTFGQGHSSSSSVFSSSRLYWSAGKYSVLS
jgi:virulence-associated protein VagC